jgi:hypothetical protein
MVIPLRASSDPHRSKRSFQAFHHEVSVFPLLLGGSLVDHPLRASNEALLRPRVARAHEINQAVLISLKWGMQFLLCFQHFPECLSFVPTFHALPHRSLRAVVEELIY